MSDDTGHRTATIPRPRPTAPARKRSGSSREAARREDARLIRTKRSRVLLALAAAIVAGALAASVLILPVRAWMNQREELTNRELELDRLVEANADLERDVERLETEQGIIETAREELGAVREDEKVYRVVMDPALTGVLPEGWLYPTIAAIIGERAAQAGAAAALAPEAPADSAP